MKTLLNTTKLSAILAAALMLATATSQLQAQQFGGPDPNGPVVFTRIGDELHMTGTIDGNTRRSLQTALNRNPGVTTIVMNDVPGSTDDDAALIVFREVRRRGLNTLVPATGIIASGGVDFFCAGVQRIAEPGSKLLVHPWEDDQLGRGNQVPLSNRIHNQYRNYYREMGVATAFYEHTLFAPRGNVIIGNFMIPDMHEMTQADLLRFRVATGTSLQSGGGQPPVEQTNTGLQQLVGTWTWTFDGGSGTVMVNADGSFGFANGTLTADGSLTLSGNQLTLHVNGQESPLTITRIAANQITFGGSRWTRQNDEAPPAPEVDTEISLDGVWTEVRTDGRIGKTISIDNGFFFEQSRFENWTGSVEFDGELLTLRGTDGNVEQYLVELTGDRLSFMEVETEQRITRFHWVRQ